MPTNNRTGLLNLIATHSFRLGSFTLASGQQSDYYIDCRTTTLHAEGGRLSGLVLSASSATHPSRRRRWRADHGSRSARLQHRFRLRLGGGRSHEIAEHRALSSKATKIPDHPTLIHGFLVRKAEKAHGTGRRVEGFLTPGAAVVIVDDVCTTGGSTITAIEATREAGMNRRRSPLPGRPRAGRPANIEAALPGVPFLSVFTATDVRAAHIAQQKSK